MNKKTLAGCLCNLLLIGAAITSPAHEQDDHAQEEKTTTPLPALSSSAGPRLVLESPQFELVGTLEGNGLRLYLDDYASNAPVTQAQIELDIAGQRITAKANADGSYDAALLQPLPDGKYPIMATLLTDQAADLLTGEFSVHLAHDQGAHAATVAPTADHGGHFLPWLVAGLAVALSVVLITLRQDSFSRRKIP